LTAEKAMSFYHPLTPSSQGIVVDRPKSNVSSMVTRAIQHYLGHRSIASTVRYTALAPDRFKNFWKD
jgi:hypothetical protein